MDFRKYCYNPAHSRPATPEEFLEDYQKRVTAIEVAIERRTHSSKEIAAARRVLETFKGYPRCTLSPPRTLAKSGQENRKD